MGLYEIIGYPLLLVGVLEVVLAAVLLRQNPRKSPVNRSVAAFAFFSAAFALNTAVMYLRAGMGLDIDLVARLNWIGWLSIPACLQVLYYMRDEKSPAAFRIGLVLYPFWTLLFFLSVFTDLVEVDGYSLIPYINKTGPLEDPARLIGAVLIVWVVAEIFRLRKELTGIRKAQLNYFFHGTLIFAGSSALAVGFLQLVSGFGLEPGLGSFLSFPWVALTFYAMTRYRLFDIRIVLSRWLTVALLFIVLSSAHLALFKLMQSHIGDAPAIVLSLTVIAVVLFGTPVRRSVQAWMHRIVVGGRFDYQRILRESARAVISILDLDELLKYTIDTMRRSLGVGNVFLFLKDGKGRFLMRQGFGTARMAAESAPLEADVIRLVKDTQHVVIREEMEGLLPEREFSGLNTALQELGAELIVPLHFKGQMQGVLTLGYKGNGEPYIQSDIDLLETLAGHVAIAIENARLFEEARQMRESLNESEERYRVMVETTVKKYLSS